VSRAARAADPVRVVLDVSGGVVVDDVRHRGHVDAAAEHVGADDDRDAPALEVPERALALALVLVAVDRGGGAAEVVQVRLECVCGALSVDKDDGLAGDRLEQLDARAGLLAPVHVHDLLGDRGGGAADAPHLEHHRLVEEGLGDAHDRARERGGEHHRLAALRPRRRHVGALDDVADLRLESHVEHPVRLIEDQEADL